MKQVLLFITLIFLGLLVSCHKSEPEEQCPDGLPCATQEGANTFGCYIDGKPWVAKVEPYVLDPSAHPFEVSYDENTYGAFNNNRLKISAEYYGEQYSYFYFRVNPVKIVGKLEKINDLYTNFTYRNSENLYVLIDETPLNLEITKLDTINNIVCGTFSFTMTNTSDTIHITDGRFDLKYNPE